MMYRFYKILQRDTINLFINPMWVFLGIAFPFLFAVILGLLTEGLYGASISSYDYYGVTMLLFCGLYSATYSANSFMEERIKKPNLRIVYSPIRNWFIPLTKTIATFLFMSFFVTLAGILLHLCFKVNFGHSLLFQSWLLLLALNFFFSSLGVLMCCIFKSEGVANQIISIITAALGLISGFFFPISVFGDTIVKFSQFLPTTMVFNAILAMIYDQDSTDFLPTLLILGLLSFIIIVLCNYLFKGEDYV